MQDVAQAWLPTSSPPLKAWWCCCPTIQVEEDGAYLFFLNQSISGGDMVVVMSNQALFLTCFCCGGNERHFHPIPQPLLREAGKEGEARMMDCCYH